MGDDVRDLQLIDLGFTGPFFTGHEGTTRNPSKGLG